MKLSRKLQKLVTGDALASALRHSRDIFTRRPLAAEAARITRTIPAREFAEIRNRHAMPEPGDEWPKYLEIERWMEINLRRVREVDLDRSRRKRVLDIGCGTGYFLYICKYFGHEVLGLDIDDVAGFGEMVALLGVPRKIWRVERFQPLPDLGRFDVIAAHMICFNGHKSDQLWGVEEWKFFLDDLERHLNLGGVITLELNREFDGTNYTPELKAYFLERGAEIHTQRVRLHPTAAGASRSELADPGRVR